MGLLRFVRAFSFRKKSPVGKEIQDCGEYPLRGFAAQEYFSAEKRPLMRRYFPPNGAFLSPGFLFRMKRKPVELRPPGPEPGSIPGMCPVPFFQKKEVSTQPRWIQLCLEDY